METVEWRGGMVRLMPMSPHDCQAPKTQGNRSSVIFCFGNAGFWQMLKAFSAALVVTNVFSPVSLSAV
jgi:hypothetical protein